MKLSEAISKYGDIDIKNSLVISHISKCKESLKKIDMSRCIESGIDCEFSDCGFSESVIGKLYEVNSGDYPYMFPGTRGFIRCRPRMNHIHACPYGFDECMLPEGFNIKVHLRNSEMGESGYSNSDIIAFEVLGISDGWEL